MLCQFFLHVHVSYTFRFIPGRLSLIDSSLPPSKIKYTLVQCTQITLPLRIVFVNMSIFCFVCLCDCCNPPPPPPSRGCQCLFSSLRFKLTLNVLVNKLFQIVARVGQLRHSSTETVKLRKL